MTQAAGNSLTREKANGNEVAMADRSELIIALAKRFLDFVRDVAPANRRAFFRYDFGEYRSGSIASVDLGVEVNLIDPFKHAVFYADMNALCDRLASTFEKPRGAFLLRIDESFNYDIQFDFDDANRWRISKIGGTGIPEGID
ncbi:MAG: hypothetical protein IT547_05515 [Hyphomonadaceae bacterium]|nr:hypothetical protein [Hyphomonadaceae bacterium]